MLNEQTPASGEQLKEAGSGAFVNVADKTEEMLGGKGFEYISNTAAHTPPAGQVYICLHLLTDTIFAAIATDASAPIVGTVTGLTFLAGTVLYGKFSSLTLTSGSLLAYKGALP